MSMLMLDKKGDGGLDFCFYVPLSEVQKKRKILKRNMLILEFF
jgi:hypothetical protein